MGFILWGSTKPILGAFCANVMSNVIIGAHYGLVKSYVVANFDHHCQG